MGSRYYGGATSKTPIYTKFASPIISAAFTTPFDRWAIKEYTVLRILPPCLLASALLLWTGSMVLQYRRNCKHPQSQMRNSNTLKNWKCGALRAPFLAVVAVSTIALIVVLGILLYISSSPDPEPNRKFFHSKTWVISLDTLCLTRLDWRLNIQGNMVWSTICFSIQPSAWRRTANKRVGLVLSRFEYVWPMGSKKCKPTHGCTALHLVELRPRYFYSTLRASVADCRWSSQESRGLLPAISSRWLSWGEVVITRLSLFLESSFNTPSPSFQAMGCRSIEYGIYSIPHRNAQHSELYFCNDGLLRRQP